MKLKHFVYAAMIACFFSACSNESDSIQQDIEGQGDASLDLRVLAPEVLKSLGGTDTDATLQTLQVYVYKEDGTLEGTSRTTQGKAGLASSRLVNGLTGGRKTVVVLANTPDYSTLNYTALQAQTKNMLLDSYLEQDGNLSMNSKAYVIDLKRGVTNYLGYNDTDAADGFQAGDGNPVYLYRNVAKICMSTLTFNPDESKYTNAILRVDSLFLLHGKQQTAVFTTEAWGATAVADAAAPQYYNGVSNDAYAAWVSYLESLSDITLKHKYVSTLSGSAPYANYVDRFVPLDFQPGGRLSFNIPKEYMFYAYEHPANDTTLMVLAGTMTYGSNPQIVITPCYYSVAIGYDGVNFTNVNLTGIDAATIAARTANGGVLRNLQYNINLTVKGPGWDTPFGPDPKDNTNLDVAVEVVPFGQVTQDVEIE